MLLISFNLFAVNVVITWDGEVDCPSQYPFVTFRATAYIGINVNCYLFWLKIQYPRENTEKKFFPDR